MELPQVKGGRKGVEQCAGNWTQNLPTYAEASSSGCSSASGDLPAEAGDNLAAQTSSRSASHEDDQLEVNELLYLRRQQRRQVARKKWRQTANSVVVLSGQLLAPTEPLASGELSAGGAHRMSQFSAFSLRKSLERKLAPSACAGEQLLPPSSSCSSCCCCLGLCPAQKSPGEPLPAPALERGSTRVGRAPLRPASSSRTTSQGRGRASLALLSSRVQQPQLARRSLPVPPPVVPLYKELALLAANCTNDVVPERPQEPLDWGPFFRPTLGEIQPQELEDSGHSHKFTYGDNWRALTCTGRRGLPAESSSGRAPKGASERDQSLEAAAKVEPTPLGRKTSRLLGRFTQGFLANFKMTTSATTTTPTKSIEPDGNNNHQWANKQMVATSCSSHGPGNCIQPSAQLIGGAESKPDGRTGDLPESGDLSAEAAIYDTPEFDAQRKPGTSGGPTKGRATKPAARPTQPPPPRPPDRRPATAGRHGDCVQAAGEGSAPALPLAPQGGLDEPKGGPPEFASRFGAQSNLIDKSKSFGVGESLRELQRQQQQTRAQREETRENSCGLIPGEKVEQSTQRQETKKVRKVVKWAAETNDRSELSSCSKQIIAEAEKKKKKPIGGSGAKLELEKGSKEVTLKRVFKGKAVEAKLELHQTEQIQQAAAATTTTTKPKLNKQPIESPISGPIIRSDGSFWCKFEPQKTRGQQISELETGDLKAKQSEASGCNCDCEGYASKQTGTNKQMGARSSNNYSGAQIGRLKQQQQQPQQQQSQAQKQQTMREINNPIRSSLEAMTGKLIGEVKRARQLAAPGRGKMNESELVLERRRKSIENGDVFIYPSRYKESNECRKCSRDNRICNCNYTSDHLNTSASSLSSASAPESASASSSDSSLKSASNSGNQLANGNGTQSGRELCGILINEKEKQQQQQQQHQLEMAPKSGQLRGLVSSDEFCGLSSILVNKRRANKVKLASITETGPVSRPEASKLPLAGSVKAPKAIASITDHQSGLKVSDETEHDRAVEIECDNYLVCGQAKQQQQQQQNRIQLKRPSNFGAPIKSAIQIYTNPGNSNLELGEIGGHFGSVVKQTNGFSSIPIESSSAITLRRRKHLTDSRLISRQAINEDDGVDQAQANLSLLTLMEANCRPIAEFIRHCPQSIVKQQQSQLETPIESSGELELQTDALEYSPILAGVRDYIKNVKIQEIQVKKAVESKECEMRSEFEAAASNLFVDHQMKKTTNESVTRANSNDKLACQLDADELAENVELEQQVKLESPKKSIFDGASKDEILEYLEDARERVPDILMVADDVIAISETELIVVNQLEPNSPPTPITIVETNNEDEINCQLIGLNGSQSDQSGQLADTSNLPLEGANGGKLTASSAPDDGVAIMPTLLHLEHLEQMYQTSIAAAAAAEESTSGGQVPTGAIQEGERLSGRDSQFNSVMSQETVEEDEDDDDDDVEGQGESEGEGESEDEEDTGIMSCDQISASMNALNSSNNSKLYDDSISVVGGGQNKAPISVSGLKNFSSLAETTLDSIDDQVSGIDSFLMDGFCNMSASGNEQTTIRLAEAANMSKTIIIADGSTVKRQSVRPTISSASQTSESEALSAASGLLEERPLPAAEGPASGRSSSNSECSSAADCHNSSAAQTAKSASTGLHKAKKQLILIQQQHLPINLSNSVDSRNGSSARPKRDSDPGSPSASLISSSSLRSAAQQTSSGNSSAASFYTSSPLSCSSPSLAALLLAGSASPISPLDHRLGDDSRASRDPPIIQQVGSGSEPADALIRTAAVELNASKLSVIDELIASTKQVDKLNSPSSSSSSSSASSSSNLSTSGSSKFAANAQAQEVRQQTGAQPQTFASSANLMSRTVHGHYATMARLNHYFMNRHHLEGTANIEFQCLDCDQFIDVDQATMINKTNEFRLLNGPEFSYPQSASPAAGGESKPLKVIIMNNADRQQLLVCGYAPETKPLTPEQLDRAYIAAMNGLPLCKLCEKKRIERKEIIGEFVETELKYGRDLKIIHDEFYRPMQIAGLLSKDQIAAVFLNLHELISANHRFSERLKLALGDAHSMGDLDFNTLNIGRLFVESAEMLNIFESYCIRQGSAACQLARLAKEKELLRIFLRVSQMENALLRRMNLAAFLMVPVQRVTRYPLLLNRLYKVTAYHHKDREALRDAQLKVELHLEHINQQTKGSSASNKIWRRFSNLSAPISNRRALINAEDIGYIKLRKTAMDLLKWDRDETQFVHSGKLNFALLNEYLTKQRTKPLRYIETHALLVVLGKPNRNYRPDLVKSTPDNRLMIWASSNGDNGIKEAALLMFREKNGRFVPCRMPLYLSNCVLSNDCSQFNADLSTTSASTSAPPNQAQQVAAAAVPAPASVSSVANPSNASLAGSASNSSAASLADINQRSGSVESEISSAQTCGLQRLGSQNSETLSISNVTCELRANSANGDTVSMASLKSLPEDPISGHWSPPVHSARSYSLASALPRSSIATSAQSSQAPNASSLTKSSSSNMTILSQIRTKVNSYSSHKQQSKAQLDLNNNTNCAAASFACNSSTFEPAAAAATTISGEQPTAKQTGAVSNGTAIIVSPSSAGQQQSADTVQHYNHHYFHSHLQRYGDHEEAFEIHERLTKESMLLRADTPLKTRFWLQMLRYHAKDLGQWRARRNGLANIMMMMRPEGE